MRKFIFILILLLAGYIGYMYFFGKGEDKAGAQTIVLESKEVGKAIGDFLKKQKDKYDDGEFDRMIQQVENSIHKLKSNSADHKEEIKSTLKDLHEELDKIDTTKLSEENKQQLKKIQDELNKELK